MKILLLVILCFFISCSNSVKLKPASDRKPKAELPKGFRGCNLNLLQKVVQEDSLFLKKNELFELRVYVFPPFENSFLMKVNYQNETITYKEFKYIDYKIDPNTGQYFDFNDTMLSSNEFTLKDEDSEIIDNLMSQSMFWDIAERSKINNQVLDGSNYIIECIDNRTALRVDYKNNYHIINAIAPLNSDLNNLIEFLKMKAGKKNIFKPNFY